MRGGDVRVGRHVAGQMGGTQQENARRRGGTHGGTSPLVPGAPQPLLFLRLPGRLHRLRRLKRHLSQGLRGRLHGAGCRREGRGGPRGGGGAVRGKDWAGTCFGSACQHAAAAAATRAPAKREEKRCGLCRTPSALTAVHTSTARSWMACRWRSVSSAVYTWSLGGPRLLQARGTTKERG